MVELIITKADVAKVLQVAVGYNDANFDSMYIREAQEFDFKPLVCEEFYYDLLSKKDDPIWDKLIKGGEYEYNNRTYYHNGISEVLSYFAYARFILKSNLVSNSHGFTIKKTPHSEPITLEERKNFYYRYRKDANTALEGIKKFIDRNKSDYPSWFCGSKCDEKPKAKFKTRVIQ